MTHSEQMEFTNHHNPFLQHCGITAQELDERHALLTAPFAPQCANTVGTVHGGMLYTMADGVVSMLARADGHAYVTLDSSFQYLCNTTEPGTLEARAELIRRGHKVSVIRVEITHRESGRLLATGTFTCCRITRRHPLKRAFVPIFSACFVQKISFSSVYFFGYCKKCKFFQKLG